MLTIGYTFQASPSFVSHILRMLNAPHIFVDLPMEIVALFEIKPFAGIPPNKGRVVCICLDEHLCHLNG